MPKVKQPTGIRALVSRAEINRLGNKYGLKIDKVNGWTIHVSCPGQPIKTARIVINKKNDAESWDHATNRPRWISATVKPKLPGYDYRLIVPKTSIEDGTWKPSMVIAEAFNKIRNLSNYQQPTTLEVEQHDN